MNSIIEQRKQNWINFYDVNSTVNRLLVVDLRQEWEERPRLWWENIEALEEYFKISRVKAVIIVGAISSVISILIENGDAVSIWMDVISIYVIPLGALLAAIMFYWVCPKGYAKQQAEIGASKPLGKYFEPVTKYVFVGITGIVYILGIFFGGIG